MGVALSAFGAGVTGDDAKGAVTGWVRLREALGDEIDAEPEAVATYQGQDGRGEFHVVSLKGGGYVITSGDTEITPILGYSKTGTFDADENSPMWALLTADVAARAAAVEASASSGAGLRLGATLRPTDEDASSAWSRLMAAGKSGGNRLQAKMSSPPTDLRVASFVRSKWSQSTATSGNGYSHNYYNYYVPNNYPCGCVATAFAQTMRYFEFPNTSVTPKTFTCKVSNVDTNLTMQGGTYDWAHMPYVPREVTYDWNNVIGIAKLTSDAGISVCMSYKSGGSSSSSVRVGDSLVSTFGYANAVADYESGGIRGNTFKKNVIPSLDAKLPVVLGIQGKPTGSVTADAGHSILTDGYGYYNNQLYIHLNMGWSGSDDAWYTPADADTDAIINTSNYNFTNIHTTVFNIFTNATRYSVIASGRVLDQSGAAISGATVTAKYYNTTYATATSDARGVYALILPPTSANSSYRTYTVNATCSGYTSTGARSISASRTVGEELIKDGNNYTGSFYLTAFNSNSYDNDITMESDNLPQAATPTSVTAAEFGTSVSVTLTCSTAGASIYYTLDGSTPTVNSTLYTGPITLTKTTTVKALAAKSGYARSDVFTRTFVSAAAIDEFYFRHDFSNGTRVFTAGEGSGLTRDQTNSTDSNAKAVDGPDGPGTAHHPGNVWGQFEDPTVLHGAWSAAMSLCMDATETGILVSFGRLNKADQKEVALLSSSTKSNFYFKVMTTDSSKAKSVENTFTVVTTNDLTVGFHSIVVAYTPASEVFNGIGSFDIYCDGVLVRTVSTDTPKLLGADVGGMQYCMFMSGGSNVAALGGVSSQANDAVAFYDFRFYDRAFTASEAAKYAAAYYPYTTAEWTNNDGTGSFDSAANWAGGRVPHSGDFIVNISGDTTINVANAYNLGVMTVQGTGNVTFTGAGSIAATTLEVASGLTVDTCGKLTVPGFVGAGNVVLTPSSDTLAISSSSTLTGDLTIKTDSSVAFNVNAATSVSNFFVRAATNAVVTMTVSGGSFISAEAIVQHGVLKQGSANALGATPKVTVEDGGTFDFNGKVVGDGEAVTGKVVTEFHIAGAGAGDWPWVLTSSESMTSSKNVCMLHLDANATVGGAKELWMGVRYGAGWSSANKNLNLNGFTLTKTGTGTLQVRRPYSRNEGTIDVQSGSVKVSGWGNANEAYGESCVSNVALVVSEGVTAENNVGYPLYFKALDCRGGTLTTSANAFGVWETLSGHGTTAKLSFGGGATATLDGNLTVSSAIMAAGALSLTRAAGVETNVTVAATGTLTASGAITVGAGVIFNIGANRPTGTLTVADGATLALRKADGSERNVVLNVTAQPQNIVVYDTDGTTVISDSTVTYNSEAGTLTIRFASRWTNNDGTGSFDSAANWTVTPESGDKVILELSGDTSITVTNTYNLGAMTVTGTGNVTFTGDGSIGATSLDVASGLTVDTCGKLTVTGFTGAGNVVLTPASDTLAISSASTLTGDLTIKTDTNMAFSVNAVTSVRKFYVNAATNAVVTMTVGSGGSFKATSEAIVQHGVLKQGGNNVLGATPKISVEDGGTFDINAKTIRQETPIYIAGAGAGDWPWALATSSGAMASGNYLYDLYLTADATIGAGQFKLGRSNQNSFIYLNGHTLTAKSWVTLRCINTMAGTLDLQAGATFNAYNNLNKQTAYRGTTMIVHQGFNYNNQTDREVYISYLKMCGGTIGYGSTARDFGVWNELHGYGTVKRLVMGSGAKYYPDGAHYLEAPEKLSGTMIIDLGDIDLTTAKRIPLFKVGSSAMLPAPEALQFVGGIPDGWELRTLKEGYGYVLVRRNFMVIIK